MDAIAKDHDEGSLVLLTDNVGWYLQTKEDWDEIWDTSGYWKVPRRNAIFVAPLALLRNVA